MLMRYIYFILFVVIAGLSYGQFANAKSESSTVETGITTGEFARNKTSKVVQKAEELTISSVNAANVDRADYVAFAKTLLGIPYLYASVDPAKGFDCSGFVNYVYHHFGLKVPRSSVNFTEYGTTVEKENSLPGDLILFTGTDASRRIVGHIGIITENSGGAISFIHSSSGKAKGVVISNLEGYYETRFVKVVRILS
jgi:cell wall-associated NlpC family hydrolase